MLVLGTVPAIFAADDAKKPEAAPAAATPAATTAAAIPAVPAVKMVSGTIKKVSADSIELDQRGTPVTLKIGTGVSIRKGAESITADKLAEGDQILALADSEGNAKSIFVKTAPAVSVTPAAAPAAPAAAEKKGY